MGVYKWKGGARFKADAQQVGEELEALETRDPASIVEYAEDERTALHTCFTWDDAKAAHQYRLEEARSVVQSVIVVDDAPEREPIAYRAFESVVIDGRRQYVQTERALSDESLRAQVFGEMAAAMSELNNKMRLYRYLAENELDTAQRHLDLAREALPV